MSPLGITIRMGAGGFTLASPAGTIDLAQLPRHQLRTVADLVSDAMGLSVQSAAPQRRRRPHRNRPHSRKKD